MLYETLLLRNYNFKMGESPGDKLMISRRVTIGSGNAVSVELGDILKPGAVIQYAIFKDAIVGDANAPTNGSLTQIDAIGTNTAIANDKNATLLVLASVEDLAESPVGMNLSPLMPAMSK